MIDSDRQAISNGITTVYHATTWSWEPGLRSADNARKLLEAIEQMRPQLAADTRFHLRHETYNLDAESEIIDWLSEGRVDLFAFNDHMDSTVASLAKPLKRSRMVERTGLTNEAFDRLVQSVVSRGHDVPASIARLAQAARAADVRMLSHDDESPAMRQAFRAQGVAIAEFPVNEETAREAAEAGDFIVFGAPNVVRGGSHTGWTRASDMIAKGLCSVLASDYYYPAPLLAAFRLAADGVLPLAEAWQLISSAPARAAGLADRGTLAAGQRADIILVDDTVPLRPRDRRGHCRGTPGASDGGAPPRPLVRRAAQGSCSRVRRPYSGAMANYPRYAIYYTAAQGSALDRFGASLLGYDAYGGDDLPFPDGLPLDWRDLTQDPRKYGFHATLKAPMALADGKAEARLAAACELFADLARPVPVIQPVVDSISGFIAVIPAEPSAELELLAAEATKAFDPFRAPLSPEDRARRNPDRADAAAARLSRPLGLPLRLRRVSLPHDADGTASRRTARAGCGDAAREVCGDRHRAARDRRDRPVPSGKSEFAVSRHWPLAIAGLTSLGASAPGRQPPYRRWL